MKADFSLILTFTSSVSLSYVSFECAIFIFFFFPSILRQKKSPFDILDIRSSEGIFFFAHSRLKTNWRQQPSWQYNSHHIYKFGWGKKIKWIKIFPSSEWHTTSTIHQCILITFQIRWINKSVWELLLRLSPKYEEALKSLFFLLEIVIINQYFDVNVLVA